MVAPADSWTVAGAIIQGYLKTIDRMGLRAAVRERVSERTKAVMDKPPLVISSVSGSILDDMMMAVAAVRGIDAVREVASRSMVDSLGVVLRTLFTSTLKLFGRSPRSIFERVGTLSAAMIRGLEFKYQPLDETSGIVSIAFPAPVSEAYQAAWEGTLEYAYALCDTTGTVRRQKEGPSRLVELRAQWKAPAS